MSGSQILLTAVTLLVLGLDPGVLQVHAAYVPEPRHVVRATEDVLLSGIPRPPQPPPIYNETIESFNSAADEVVRKEKAVVDEIVASVVENNATFENVLLPYLQWENEWFQESCRFDTCKDLCVDPDIKSAAENGSARLYEVQKATYVRQDFFKLVDAVYKKQGNDSSLSLEDLRVLTGPDYGSSYTGMWEHFKNLGQDIKDDKDRARLLEILNRLKVAGFEFDDTTDKDNTTIKFTAEELQGTDADFLARLDKADDGKLIVPMTENNYETIVGKAKNATTRYKNYIAYSNKAPSNIDRLLEIVTIRDEAARLLELPDWATYKVKTQMAKTPQAVDEFLAQLVKNLTPGARKVIDYQKELKKRETGNADHFYLWDSYYYETKQDEENQVNYTLISEWFETNTTVKRVLDIFAEVYGIRFDRIEGRDADQLSPTGNGSDILLHPDQHLYAVWDAASSSHYDDENTTSTQFQGYLYVDLFNRDSKAGGGFAEPVNTGYTKPDGSKFYPAACASLDLDKSATDRPSFIDNMETFGTLFHELGHCMHQILSNQKYARLSGFGGTPVDFVETPSQLMEQYALIPTVLQRVSRHYSYISPDYLEVWKKDNPNGTQPKETLPAAQIEAIQKNKNAHSAFGAMTQVFFATYDMQINEAAHRQDPDFDLTVLFNQLRANFTLLEGPETLGLGWKAIHRESIFHHFADPQYGAGYYGYQYSLVNCLDVLYSAFVEDPFDAKVGAKWRNILAAGGTRDPEEMLEEFLGRKPSDEAYYENLNITTT